MTCWDQRLAAAEARGSFTSEDVRDAGDWTSCSLGEQMAIRGLQCSGWIITIDDLARKFDNAVKGWGEYNSFEEQIAEAKRIHEKIKAEVLRQLGPS